MSDLAALATGLGTVAITFAFLAVLIVTWLWAIGDIFWMVMLRPRMIGGVLAVIAFVVMLATFAMMPWQARTAGDLPLIAAGVIAPILARLLADPLARWEYRRRKAAYAFELEDPQIRNSTLFLLARGQQIARYHPPKSAERSKLTPI